MEDRGSSGRLRVLATGIFWLLLLAAVPLALAAAPRQPDSASSDQVQALQRAGDAVVALRVTVTEGAPSAETLGPRRTGSGVVIGADGLILTIGYLLLEAETIEVITHDERVLPARQVAYDLATGFGLLRPLVPLRGVQPVPLAGVGGLTPGELLLAATGSDSGTEVGFTRLIGVRPFSGYWEYHIESALFTSPPIPAHSGAPLFNRNGELLGIGSLFVLESVPGQDRPTPGNMFVPVELLRPVLDEMKANGYTRASVRPWLGLSSSERDGHVQIVRVDRQGPALAAGIRPGDVVLEVDGIGVATLEAFYKQLWKRGAPDAEVELTVQQGSETRKVRIHAVDRMKTLRKPAGI
jgi:serine protease Do